MKIEIYLFHKKNNNYNQDQWVNTKEIKTWLKVRNNCLATEVVQKQIKRSNNNDVHCDIENGVLIFIRYPYMQESIVGSMGLFFCCR